MHISSMPSAANHAQQNRQSPAQEARNLLTTRDDLADQPFGKLVSMFARGEPIPSGASDAVDGGTQTADATPSTPVMLDPGA
jgi:hypothetical protein